MGHSVLCYKQKLGHFGLLIVSQKHYYCSFSHVKASKESVGWSASWSLPLFSFSPFLPSQMRWRLREPFLLKLSTSQSLKFPSITTMKIWRKKQRTNCPLSRFLVMTTVAKVGKRLGKRLRSISAQVSQIHIAWQIHNFSLTQFFRLEPGMHGAPCTLWVKAMDKFFECVFLISYISYHLFLGGKAGSFQAGAALTLANIWRPGWGEPLIFDNKSDRCKQNKYNIGFNFTLNQFTAKGVQYPRELEDGNLCPTTKSWNWKRDWERSKLSGKAWIISL